MQTEELIDDLARKMETVSPAPSPVRILIKWLIMSMAYLAIFLCFIGIRQDLFHKFHSVLFDAELVILAGIIVSSLLSSAILAFPDMYQQKKVALLPIIMFVVFTLFMIVSFYADNPPAPLPVHNIECLIFITVSSLFPGSFMLYNIRKFASTHYYMAGCTCTLASFSIGALILRISEDTDSVTHLIQWHYLPMLGVAVIGLFIGKLFLKWQ